MSALMILPLLFSAPAERPIVRVAVYDLEVQQDGPWPDGVGRVVTDALVAEVRKLDRVVVVSMDEVRAMLDLETQKQLAGCEAESCLSEIADSLGVQEVIIGNIASVGGETVFGLRRLSQEQAKALGQVNQRLKPEGGEELLAAIGPSVESLYKDFPLRAGLERGIAPELALRLNPPPLSPEVFWTSAAITGGLAIASAAAGVVNLALFNQMSDLEKRAERSLSAGIDVVRAREANDVAALITWALVASTAVFATATGAAYVFTDWE